MKAWRKRSLENVHCYGSHNFQARIAHQVLSICENKNEKESKETIYEFCCLPIVKHRLAKRIARYGF